MGLAIVMLARGSTGSDFALEPAWYIKAAGEMLFLALVVSWVLTAAFNPQIIESNPLKSMFGYNNPCVGWDTAPAQYPAAGLFALCVYCMLRYAALDNQRAALDTALPAWKRRFTYVANGLVAVSICAGSLLFVVTPDRDVKAHTALFLQLMFFRWLAIGANFVESHRVTRAEWAYMAVYTLVSLNSFTCASITLVLTDGFTPVVPPTYMMFSDYAWFALLPLTTLFMPAQGGHVRIQSSLVADPDAPMRGAASTAVAPAPEAGDDGAHSALARRTARLIRRTLAAWDAARRAPSAEENDHNYKSLLGQGNTLGFVSGRLELEPSLLPAAQRVGLFGLGEAKLPAIVRFSDFKKDGGSQLARMAVKLGLPEAIESDHGEANMLTTESLDVFPLSGDRAVGWFASRFGLGHPSEPVERIDIFESITAVAQAARAVVSSLGRVRSGKALRISAKTFHSQLPYACGSAAMRFKFEAEPAEARTPPSALPDIGPTAWRERFRADLAEDLSSTDLRFKLSVQLHAEPESRLVAQQVPHTHIPSPRPAPPTPQPPTPACAHATTTTAAATTAAATTAAAAAALPPPPPTLDLTSLRCPSSRAQSHLRWPGAYIEVGTLVLPRANVAAGVSRVLQDALAEKLGPDHGAPATLHKAFRFHASHTAAAHRPLGEVNAFRSHFYGPYAHAVRGAEMQRGVFAGPTAKCPFAGDADAAAASAPRVPFTELARDNPSLFFGAAAPK